MSDGEREDEGGSVLPSEQMNAYGSGRSLCGVVTMVEERGVWHASSPEALGWRAVAGSLDELKVLVQEAIDGGLFTSGRAAAS